MTNLASPSSGGEKSEVPMSTRSVPLEVQRETLIQAWLQFPVVASSPWCSWLVGASL